MLVGEVVVDWNVNLLIFEVGINVVMCFVFGKMINVIVVELLEFFGGFVDLGCLNKIFIDVSLVYSI